MAVLTNQPLILLTNLFTLKRALQSRSVPLITRVASIQFLVPGLLGIAIVFLQAADQDLAVLHKQLQAAEDATDNAAIVELSRRIVDLDSNDSEVWQTL